MVRSLLIAPPQNYSFVCEQCPVWYGFGGGAKAICEIIAYSLNIAFISQFTIRHSVTLWLYRPTTRCGRVKLNLHVNHYYFWKLIKKMKNKICTVIALFWRLFFVSLKLSEENTVKIADVGMAKAEIDITGTFAGTPIYMAPEVFHYRVYGTMADIYSLGLIMWEMWYGRRVFADAPTTTLQEFFNWVDEGNRPVEMQGCKSPPSFWEQLMKQCWDGNPVKRPTAKECHETMIRMIESVSPESSVWVDIDKQDNEWNDELIC